MQPDVIIFSGYKQWPRQGEGPGFSSRQTKRENMRERKKRNKEMKEKRETKNEGVRMGRGCKTVSKLTFQPFN